MTDLRPYQSDAVDALRACVMAGSKSPLLVMPTGSGKTHVAKTIIESAVAKGKQVLFLAPRRELIYQTADKLDEAGVEYGVIMAGEQKKMFAPVQVACIPTIFRRLEHTLPPPADLVIVDEAHLSISRMAKTVMEAYPNAKKIGLTATPSRTDGKGLGEVYDQIVMGPSVADLTEQGFLVKAEYYAPSKPDLEGVKITAGDYNKKQLGERMYPLIGDVVSNWARIARDRQTVVFSVNVAHSRHLCEMFNEFGVRAEHIDAKTPTEDRKAILRRVKAGDTQVICNCDVLSYGWDSPPISCAVLARPTKSLARYLQAAGRILRPYPGKENCVAAGTMILTDAGEVAIEDVTLDHKVWDGVNFVSHKGTVNQGYQKVMEYDGLVATPDHEVMTNDGWQRFEEAANRSLRVTRTGFGGVPIRYVTDCVKKGGGAELQIARRGGVQKLWQSAYGALQQFAKASIDAGLPALQPTETDPRSDMALSQMPDATATVHESKGTRVQELWWSWYRIWFPGCQRGGALGCGKSRDSEGFVNSTGSNRQRRPLRSGEYSLGNACYSVGESAWGSGSSAAFHIFSRVVSACQVRGQNALSVYLRGINGQRNRGSVAHAVVQAEREVWDILDAGALQRYTANGRLVHNCVIIDHTGVVDTLGFVDDVIPWTLDGDDSVEERKKETQKKEPVQLECPKCSAVFKETDTCPACGHRMVDERKKAIEARDADLAVVDRKTRLAMGREWTPDEKRTFYGELLGIARQRKYKDGWASMKYKERLGVWPVFKGGVVPASVETVSWVKSRQIAWAKSQQRK